MSNKLVTSPYTGDTVEANVRFECDKFTLYECEGQYFVVYPTGVSLKLSEVGKRLRKWLFAKFCSVVPSL